jgi:hypothetical protein
VPPVRPEDDDEYAALQAAFDEDDGGYSPPPVVNEAAVPEQGTERPAFQPPRMLKTAAEALFDGDLQQFLQDGRDTFETVLSIVKRFESNEFGLIGQIIPMVRLLVRTLETVPPILEAYGQAALNKFRELDAKHCSQRPILYIASMLHPWGIDSTWTQDAWTLPNPREMQHAEEAILAELRKMEPPRRVGRTVAQSLDDRAVPGSVQRPTEGATQSPAAQWRMFLEIKGRLQANPTDVEKTYRRKPEEFWRLHKLDLSYVYRIAYTRWRWSASRFSPEGSPAFAT